jgi:hypothetical protein
LTLDSASRRSVVQRMSGITALLPPPLPPPPSLVPPAPPCITAPPPLARMIT